ncbi:MAG: hypothetical protein JWR28_3204, partial [Modestobacter sp.]|nr:hypothetical protein [Modestobacter sp.]
MSSSSSKSSDASGRRALLPGPGIGGSGGTVIPPPCGAAPGWPGRGAAGEDGAAA